MDDPAPRPAEPSTKLRRPIQKLKPNLRLSLRPASPARLPGDASRPSEGAADVPNGPLHDPVTPAPPAPPPDGNDPPAHPKGVEALKAEAKSTHHLMTHISKNPFCEVCKRAKIYKPPAYKVGGTRTIEATPFGDHMTADHITIRRDKDTDRRGTQTCTCCQGCPHCLHVGLSSSIEV